MENTYVLNIFNFFLVNYTFDQIKLFQLICNTISDNFYLDDLIFPPKEKPPQLLELKPWVKRPSPTFPRNL